jgi:hypothetical protein
MGDVGEAQQTSFSRERPYSPISYLIALLPIRFTVPINRPIIKALGPHLIILEKVVKGLVGHEVGIEVHNNLHLLNAGRLAPIITVTESIDIQALTGKILNRLQADVVLKDKALDTGFLITVVSIRMLLKPIGHRLKEILGIIVLPKLFQLLVHNRTFYWLHCTICKDRAKLIGLAISALDYFPVEVKDAEPNPTQELLTVFVRLVDGRKILGFKAVPNPVVDDDGAGLRFHILILHFFIFVLETQSIHIRNQFKPKGFLALVEPLIVDVLVGTAHKGSQCIKHSFSDEAVINTEEGESYEYEVEADTFAQATEQAENFANDLMVDITYVECYLVA